MKKVILLIIYLLFLLINSTLSQPTGKFEVNINPGIINYYIPEDYSSQGSYPLIIAMPLGGMSGFDFRDRIIPPAKELKAVLICPDDNQWTNSLIQRAINHAKQNYSIDDDKIILTGHSVGGGFVFQYGISNINNIKGVIGIAPSLYGLSFTETFIKTEPIGLIVGSIDLFKTDSDMLYSYYEQMKGKCKYIIKEGVDHDGPYFTSDEFKDDWIDCYDFIIDDTPSEIQEGRIDDFIQIYPNPMSSDGRIKFILDNNSFVEISIQDILGNNVKQIEKCYLPLNEYCYTFSIEDLQAGLYFLKFNIDGLIYTKKIVVAPW